MVKKCVFTLSRAAAIRNRWGAMEKNLPEAKVWPVGKPSLRAQASPLQRRWAIQFYESLVFGFPSPPR